MTHGSYSLLWINHFAVAPNEGGGTRHFEIGRELAGRGIRVAIAASDFLLLARRYSRRIGASDRRKITEEIDGVRFVWLWAAMYQTSSWSRLHNWLTFARSVANSDLAIERPDVVIGSSPDLFTALASARLARQLSVPFVFEVRDLWPESLVAVTGRKGPSYYVLSLIANYLYRRADRIMVLARGTADHLVERGVAPHRIFYVPNGVDVDAYAGVERPARDGFTAMYTGAHGPANGLEVILDAAERLLKRSDIRIILIGDGPSKLALEMDAARRGLRNVEFRPPVAKRDMPRLLAEGDAGIMVLKDASLFGFGVSPNKLFDYFAASLPIVCNVPGDVARMVRDAGAGEQAADSSGRSLADALIRIADRDPMERMAMGASGRRWVMREHSRPVLADRLHSALLAVLKK